MKLDDVLAQYRVGFRHNPNQFKDGQFEVECDGGRMVLVGVVKKKVRLRGKRFRVVGVIKRQRK